ncbi:thiamine pyrophosphate-dependent enzyme [Bradyrhizobium pachyrhizi]|uniref:thiamine pyrophosphate-dependent enzyme n=1 Tax=Bradyrhizobium pachyrhizi TaxID=280333 RepID=UPI000A627361|nr:thiamine pyrophosphate-dependent enzyme [Bradyrhizobium pachyrhizi]
MKENGSGLANLAGSSKEFYEEPQAPTAWQIVDALEQAGVTHVVSLADNWTVRVHEALALGKTPIKLVHTCREGENIPIAAGLMAAGKNPVVMMQNSGFFESGDSTRLGIQLCLPLVMLIGYRGWGGGGNPNVRGRFTEPVLRALDIPYEIVDSATSVSAIGRAFKRAQERRGPAAVLLPGVGPAGIDAGIRLRADHSEEVFDGPASLSGVQPVASRVSASKARMDYLQSLRCLSSHRTDQIVISHETADRVWPLVSKRADFDLVGLPCMSKACSLAVGVAMGRPDRKVWVLDGDGSLAMNLGSLATEADWRPRNLVHFVCQNFEYEITADQPFPSADCIDFAMIARGCGFRRVFTFDDLDELERGLPEAISGSDLTLVVLKVMPAGAQAGPYRYLLPEHVQQFRATLAKT